MTRANKKDLEKILSTLGKSQICEIVQCLAGKADLPSKHITLAIKHYTAKGEIGIAADIAQSTGRKQEAKELYCKVAEIKLSENRVWDAIDVYLSVGCIDEALGLCEKHKLFSKGYEIAAKEGLAEKVKEYYVQELLKLGAKKENAEKIAADRIAKKLPPPKPNYAFRDTYSCSWQKDHHIRAVLDAELGNTAEAIETFESLKRYDLIIKILREEGKEKEAVEIAEKAINEFQDLSKKAQFSYEQAAYAINALEIALVFEEKYKDKISELRDFLIDNYIKRQHFQTAAEIAEDAGYQDKAKEYYKIAMAQSENDLKFKDAAEIARHIGLEKNAQRYEYLDDLLNQW